MDEKCTHQIKQEIFLNVDCAAEQLLSPRVVDSFAKYGLKCHMHVSPTSTNFINTVYVIQIHITLVGASKNKPAVLVCLLP